MSFHSRRRQDASIPVGREVDDARIIGLSSPVAT